MSPITIVCSPLLVNAAQVVSPIGGVRCTPPATTFRSARGTETLNTPSFSSSFPLTPVSCSICAVLSGAADAIAETNIMPSKVMRPIVVSLVVSPRASVTSKPASDDEAGRGRRNRQPRRLAPDHAQDEERYARGLQHRVEDEPGHDALLDGAGSAVAATSQRDERAEHRHRQL